MPTAKQSMAELTQRFERRGQAYVRGFKQGLGEHATFLGERAQANAPVQTGELRDSIVVRDLTAQPDTPHFLIDAEAPYSLAVHERPETEDQAHAQENTPEGHPGRKFLSRPLEQHHGRVMDAISRAVVGEQEKV